jgi:LPXTG-motif cell wall-anchored protein
VARGHRRRSNGIRIAGIALALAGAALTVAGVANAATEKAGDGPSFSVTVGGADTGGDNGNQNGGQNGGSDQPPGQNGDQPITSDSTPAAPTPSQDGSTAGGSAGTSTTTDGDESSSGGSAVPTAMAPMTQPAARTQLAETGGNGDTTLILVGGCTFVLGGAVFRFGPRAATARKH